MQVVDLAPVIVLTAVGGVIAPWSRMPLPIFLVVVGAVASFLPGLQAVHVDPEVFLLLFIPPLLFADARVLPRRDLLHILKPVLLLALGLVVLTVVAVGYFIHWLIPGVPLAVAFVLGAIISPTDAVATAATTSTMPLPARVSHIVNAESLLNDATGLVAFKLAVAAAVAAGHTSMDLVTGQFVILSGGGLCVGIVIEWLGRKVRERLIRMDNDDPVVQTLLTVLVPYAAYLVAEALHVSGILAVVASGLWAGGQEVKGLSVESRRHAREVWRMIAWFFNGLVFVLLGLQLRQMVAGVANHDAMHLAYWAIALWLVLMALRIGWVWASGYARFHFGWGWAGGGRRAGPAPHVPRGLGGGARLDHARDRTLGAARHAGRTPFPERDLVVFLAAATIILTLGLNGLTLPWIIPRLQARDDPEGPREEAHARVELAKAAIAALQPAVQRLEAGGGQGIRACPAFALPGEGGTARERARVRGDAQRPDRRRPPVAAGRNRGGACAIAGAAPGRRDQRRNRAHHRGGARRARAGDFGGSGQGVGATSLPGEAGREGTTLPLPQRRARRQHGRPRLQCLQRATVRWYREWPARHDTGMSGAMPSTSLLPSARRRTQSGTRSVAPERARRIAMPPLV